MVSVFQSLLYSFLSHFSQSKCLICIWVIFMIHAKNPSTGTHMKHTTDDNFGSIDIVLTVILKIFFIETQYQIYVCPTQTRNNNFNYDRLTENI